MNELPEDAKTRASGRLGLSAAANGRWQQILRVAIDVIGERGYASTSMQDIADEVGILKGSLYYYIDSKRDLLEAIVEEFFEVWHSSTAEVYASEGDVLDRLRALVWQDVLVTGEHARRMAIFHREVGELSRDLRERILTARAAHRDYLRDLVTEGQEAGVFERSLSPKLSAFAILSLTDVHSWFDAQGDWEIDFVAEQYVELVVRSLRNEMGVPNG